MGTEGLLSFAEAQARMLAGLVPLAAERVGLADAAGRVLAEDLRAPYALPRFDYSAMDGYAVKAADLADGGPWRLRVEGESRAGGAPPSLAPGTACRIFTGAAIPPGADAVVMQEHAQRTADAIVLEKRPAPGQNIRLAGEDIATGAVAVPRGSRASAGALALAAMLDATEVVVARRPRVTILSTGEELRAPGAVASSATSIPESNGVALQALARRAAADVRLAPIAKDDPDETLRAIEQALEGTDVLVTVGGVSVGDHDVVRPALERAGVTLDFWRVAIKPGKPLAVGKRGTCRVLGLPGNPASALVTFALFGMPLLRAQQGDARPHAPLLLASLSRGRKRSPDRLELLRATLHRAGDGLLATPHDNQASGAATSLALSDGLAFIPPGGSPIEAGAPVDFLRWDDA
jgi:molybdopterin molybdotransferase